jgi:hypothetical protein
MDEGGRRGVNWSDGDLSVIARGMRLRTGEYNRAGRAVGHVGGSLECRGWSDGEDVRTYEAMWVWIRLV